MNVFACGICQLWLAEDDFDWNNQDSVHTLICRDCAEKLDKQKVTGRCAYCGLPLLECDCDDETWSK